MAELSLRDFLERLKEDVRQICTDRGNRFENESERGIAFQIWCARLISEYETTYETDPDDAWLTSNDLKADLVLDDPSRSHLLICQCKFEGTSKHADAEESEINDFFSRHGRFMDRAWVRKHGSQQAQALLSDYGERIEDGYEVTFRFITTAKASERISELVQSKNDEYASRKLAVKCELLDRYRLKDYFVRAQTMDDGAPEQVTVQLREGRWFEKDGPHPTVVAVVQGNVLRNLYRLHKERLFNWNIRGYLGARNINSQIQITAEGRPDDFFYFNNGVSAICTDYELKENAIVATGFQIVNGAQTVGALNGARPSASIDVLFRLTRTLSVKSDKGFNQELIRFNNTQNVIKVSDFRANDPIQGWLQRQFGERKARGPLPLVTYVPKRAVRRSTGVVLRLEEMAKLRYAFLYEPCLIHADPKALWTPSENGGGAYEKSFGVDGTVPEVWTHVEFDRALLAIALYIRIEAETKRLAASSADLKFLRRLRFHALALFGAAFRVIDASRVAQLVGSESEFAQQWDAQWAPIMTLLSDAYADHVESGKMTMFAFVRSPAVWDALLKKMERRLLLAGATPGARRPSSPPPALRPSSRPPPPKAKRR